MTAFVGLTGGIASGKSTVGRMFADLGAAVVAADEVAREIVERGSEGLAEIVVRVPLFCPEIHDESAIDRSHDDPLDLDRRSEDPLRDDSHAAGVRRGCVGGNPESRGGG